MSPAMATETPCDYSSKDKVIYEGKIESVRLIKKDIQSNAKIKDVLKCVISIEARIKGKWYPSRGEYLFGPDMSQKDACDLAENRAKVKVMREIIPETLKSEKNLKCNLTKVRQGCKVVYMNTSIGKVKFMESCEK
jgi:hypothetical protein|tara:strand:- start:236 stop:643 length:408 start_codon:yes stop_codon:yes gene_type:complete